MSEIVERVARAICLAHLDDETRAVVDAKTYPVTPGYYDLAKAAIEAMREPTDEMMAAGQRYNTEYDVGMRLCWQAMIGEALK